MIHTTLRQAGLIIFAFAAWLLAGCSSTPMSRIDKNRAVYESWPVDMQSAVYQGKVIAGMTPEMVRMALGEPTRIEPKVGSTTGEETWIYQNGGGMNLPRPNISLGGGIGGLGVSTGGRRSGGGGGGSRNASGSAQEQEVVFQNGVVIRAG